jgi:hypothetical protein
VTIGDRGYRMGWCLHYLLLLLPAPNNNSSCTSPTYFNCAHAHTRQSHHITNTNIQELSFILWIPRRCKGMHHSYSGWHNRMWWHSYSGWPSIMSLSFAVHTSKVSRYRIRMFTCRGESSQLILVEGHIV